MALVQERNEELAKSLTESEPERSRVEPEPDSDRPVVFLLAFVAKSLFAPLHRFYEEQLG